MHVWCYPDCTSDCWIDNMKLETELNCLYTYRKQGRFCLCLSGVCLSPTYSAVQSTRKSRKENLVFGYFQKNDSVNFLQPCVELIVCLCSVSAVIHGFPGEQNYQTFSNASSFFSMPFLLNICCQHRPRVLYSFKFAFQNPNVNIRKKESDIRIPAYAKESVF